MSLPVTFHRAASAEFIEASAWYEGKRLGLGLEFIAEIDRCVSLASKNLSSFPLFAKVFGVSSPIVFHIAFIFVRRNIALLSWRYFMATETPPFGWQEPNLIYGRPLLPSVQSTILRAGKDCSHTSGFLARLPFLQPR
jgi:hypothetical protein